MTRLPTAARLALLLLPALLVVGALFLGGLALGVAQSLGYQPYLSEWSWSAAAYTGLWTDPAVRASLALTLRIAVVSTTVSALLALGIAHVVHTPRWGGRAVVGLLHLVLPVPHLVGALAMSLLLAQSGLLSRVAHAAGWTRAPADFPALTQDAFGWAVVAEYVWKETPFVTLVLLAALGRTVRPFEDVARTLGASSWQRFRHVTLPLVTPSLSAASIVVFAFTVGSYEVPAVLGRSYPAPLSVVAYQRYADTDLAARPQAFAITVVIAVVVSLLVALYLTVVTGTGALR